MDKILIINKIKSYLGFKTDTELAEFLGTSQSNIATWKKRNTINYELIIEKCPNIDANWLITGKNQMLKSTSKENISTGLKPLTKSQIIDEIIDFLGMDNDAQLAKSLKTSKDLINYWRKNNALDYEIIIKNYSFFNAEWLITGNGEKLKHDQYATKDDLQKIYSLIEKMNLKQETFFELMVTIFDKEEEKRDDFDALNEFKNRLDSIN